MQISDHLWDFKITKFQTKKEPWHTHTLSRISQEVHREGWPRWLSLPVPGKWSQSHPSSRSLTSLGWHLEFSYQEPSRPGLPCGSSTPELCCDGGWGLALKWKFSPTSFKCDGPFPIRLIFILRRYICSFRRFCDSLSFPFIHTYTHSHTHISAPVCKEWLKGNSIYI